MSYIDDLIKKECAENPEFEKEFKKEQERLDVAVALVKLREETGLTQQQLADLANKPQSTIARIENGTINPSFRLLAEIAQSVHKELKIQFV